MKKRTLLGLLMLCCATLFAQENRLINLRMEARADYQSEYRNSSAVNDNSGFKGKFLNIRMDGNITDDFSYSYRQRLNKPNGNASFFDATDWIYLTYTNSNWSLSAGKQVVGIGGYEYDRAPIDLYFCSEYWNNIPCYKIGASVAYTTDSGKDKYLLQVCESPFRDNQFNIENKQMYAYNLMWYGSHGWFNTIYSTNIIEFLPGKYINYIVLGHKVNFGCFSLELDIMNRATDEHAFFGKDMSIMGELQWRPLESLNVFAHVTYDVNNTDAAGDFCVVPGTEITRVGGGVEFYPIKGSPDVRLHLNGCYTYGCNGNSAGALQPEQTILAAGITWRMNLLSLKR
ncbi:MAG: porin [Bacteroidaceae bacterium]|nr:porin [Bacteroidaceae bacterium]